MVNVSLSRERTRARPQVGGWPVVNVPARTRRHGLNSRGYTIALVVIDYVVAGGSFALGLLLLSTVSRVNENHLNHFLTNLQHGFWYPIGIVLGFAGTGGYRRSRRSPTQSTFSDLKDFAMSVSVGGVLAMTMSYVAHHFGQWALQVPTQVIFAIIISTVMIAMSHALLRHFVLARDPQRVAVVDNGSTYASIATHLHLEHGVTLVGRIDVGGHGGKEAIGSIEQIDRLVADFDLDRVIFGAMEISDPAVEHAYRRATEIADTALVPRMADVVSWRSRLTELSGLPLLELAPYSTTAYDRALKRGFDVVVATFFLVVSLPLTLVLALLIKLTSRGPVLFSQTRLGKDRRPFTILKFRTMRVEAAAVTDPVAVPEDERDRSPLYVARAKHAEAPRLTPIGAFLRRTGLDEIPQFLNVLTGSMSVVGPRPFISEESEGHSSWSERRYEVRPGITGLWQVSGRNNLTEEELRQLDYLYVSAWSMWWDIKICFDTPRAMLRGLGAA